MWGAVVPTRIPLCDLRDTVSAWSQTAEIGQKRLTEAVDQAQEKYVPTMDD